jgi:HEAT repeat protein
MTIVDGGLAVCIRSGLLTALVLLTGSIVSSDRPQQPQQHPWAEFERELLRSGVQVDTTSVIEAAISHPDEGVRWIAVELLGRRGESIATGALQKILLNDESRLVRETAALALVRLGHKDALTDAKEFVATTEDPSRRVYLAGQLAELGEFSAYPQVASAAVSNDEHLRFLSAGVLVRFATSGFTKSKGQASPQDLLMRLLKDPSSKVRGEALLEISVGSGRGLSLRPFLPQVKSMAKEDPDPGVREQARLQLIYWKESYKAGE